MNEWVLVVITLVNHGYAIAMHDFIGEQACLKAGQEIVRQAPDIKFICVAKRRP